MNGKEFFIIRMEAGSASSSASLASIPVVKVIRDLKNEIKVLQDQFDAIDTKGGRRM